MSYIKIEDIYVKIKIYVLYIENLCQSINGKNWVNLKIISDGMGQCIIVQ